MFNSWFEQIRFPLESIQVLQKAIVSQMLALKDSSKEKAIVEHRIYNFTEMIQQKARDVINFLRQQKAMKKEQMAIVQGQKSLKASQKVKAIDVIWQNFYDRSRQIKQYYKKNQNNIRQDLSQNTIQFFRRIVFLPPFKQPQFSIEQNKGKFVDLHNVYLQFINICKALEEKDGLKLHDYLWFLQNLDKFDDFSLNKKMKHHFNFSRAIYNLSQKDQDLSFIFSNFQRNKFKSGNIHGWEPQHDNIFQQEWQYCTYCQKLFIRERAYIDHLSGKNHLKCLKNKQNIDINQPSFIAQMLKKQEQAKEEFKKAHELKIKQIAFQQFKIIKFREQLTNNIYDTMNLVRKKQTRGYEEADQLIDESSESENADAPIYNPKNLPLGWDGKPIPYWLYKLHGLGIQYKCQICGNFSYWGRRAFQMHFQQWRHTYGMKCLKIPNTIHFKDVTTISDALSLHEKLLRQSQQSQFRPDIEQEFQDNQGNILNKKTYNDMKKQGLIDS